jgi:hypothetical protein
MHLILGKATQVVVWKTKKLRIGRNDLKKEQMLEGDNHISSVKRNMATMRTGAMESRKMYINAKAKV